MVKKIAVVLGMHRSGTSLLTKAIIDTGFYPGDDLMASKPDNPKGFWEDVRIVALNDFLLDKFSCKWHTIDNVSFDDFNKFDWILNDEDYAKGEAIIKSLLDISDNIVIKDPRMCVLLEYWKRVFSKFDAEVKYVVVYRNPLETAQSLAKRNEMNMEYGLKLWLYYNSMILKTIDKDFSLCSYNDVIEDPTTALRKIEHFLECESNDGSDFFANEYIDKSLKHHNARLEEYSDILSDMQSLSKVTSSFNDWKKNLTVTSEEAYEFFSQNVDLISVDLGQKTSSESHDTYKLYTYDSQGNIIDELIGVTQRRNIIEVENKKIDDVFRLLLIPSEMNCIIRINSIRIWNDEAISIPEEIGDNVWFKSNSIYLIDKNESYVYINIYNLEYSRIVFDFEVYYLDANLMSAIYKIRESYLEIKNNEMREEIVKNMKLKLEQSLSNSFKEQDVKLNDKMKEMEASLSNLILENQMFVENVVREKDNLEQERENLEQKTARLEYEKKQLEVDKERLEEDKERLKLKNEIVEREKGNLKDENSNLSLKFTQKINENQILNDKLMALQDCVESIKENNFMLLQQIDLLEQNQSELLKENETKDRYITEIAEKLFLKKLEIRENSIASEFYEEGKLMLPDTLRDRVEEEINSSMDLKEEYRIFKASVTDIALLMDTLDKVLSDDVNAMNLKKFSEVCDTLKSENEKLNFELESNVKTIAELKKWGSSLHEQSEKTNEILNSRQSEIEKLSKWGQMLDNELKSIQNSRSWRIVNLLQRSSNKVLPLHSRRRMFVKMLLYFLKHPLYFIKYFRFKNIKLLLKKLKTENPSDIFRFMKMKIEDNLGLGSIEPIVINKSEEKIVEKLEIPVFDEIDVSIIIPAYNQFNYNINCITSVVNNTSDISYEIILIDDVSTDNTSRIEDWVSNIRVIRNKENKGFLINCNMGAEIAKGKYVFLLNNDTQVQPNWLNSLVGLIDNDDSIGLVGSKLVYPTGELQEAGGIMWNDGSAWNYGRNDNPSKPEYNYVRDTDYISGAAIMVRKDLWDIIGGFDTRFVPAYYEDVDLAFEIRKHGYRTVYQPQSVVVHFEGVSNGTSTDSGLKKYQVENREKFFEKWKDELITNHFPNAVNVFDARGRSKDKKTILVVDHYVPHYDKDCGSRIMYMYLKLFVDMGYEVKFLGDNFYAHQPYTSELEQMGIEVLYGAWYANNYAQWIKDNGANIDFVYLWRPHISKKYIDLVKEHTDAKILYFVVDLHYLREQRQYEVEQREELLISSKKWYELESELIEKSDVVLTISCDEKEIIEKEFKHQNTQVFPAFFFNQMGGPIDRSDKTGLLFVGGFAHTPNVDGVIWFVNEVLPLIVKHIPDIYLNLVGSNPPEEILALESKHVVVKGFVSDEELSNLYDESKIGVIPLRFGAGVKGKTVEALYNGLPIVSTSIGIEGLSNIDQVLASFDTKIDFANEVIRLHNMSSDRLNEIVAKEQNYVMNNFTRESAMAVFKDIFTS